MDPKQIVADGYDRIAERYAEWAGGGEGDPRDRNLDLLLGRLPVGATVLDLGCGTGALTTRRLAARFAVTGVDISARSVELARHNVPVATFQHADMTALDLPLASVDGVAAFYSLTHVPRHQHGPLLRAVAGWLRPGGILVATMGAGDLAGEIEADWLGAPMFFSHFDAAENARLVAASGLRVRSARVETTDEVGAAVPFLWVVAERPRERTRNTT